LLESIRDTGSISAAARDMGMSYKRAWLLLDSTNQAFTELVVTASPGGAGGGGATLTPFGAELLERYHRVHCAECVEVALHTGDALHGGGDVRLATHPGNEAFRRCALIGKQGAAIGAQYGGEGWRCAGDRGQPPLHQRLGRFDKCCRVGCVGPARGEHLLLERVEPGVDDGAQRTVRRVGRGKALRWLQERARGAGFATSEVQVSETETPLHRSEAVYRRLIGRPAARAN
jgi:molybdate transport repressor ModE-like protein